MATYNMAESKSPKLSGHLVDLLAVTSRLQTNSMNATWTNFDHRAKVQHHHCTHFLRVRRRLHFSPLSVLPSTCVQRLFQNQRPSQGPYPGSLSVRPRPLFGSQTLFGASDHRGRAGLEPRVGRPPCSPTGRDPCVVHTTPEPARTAETTCGPREDASPLTNDRRVW